MISRRTVLRGLLGGSAAMLLNPDGSLRNVPNPLQNFMAITGADSFRQFRLGLRVSF